MGIFRDKLNIAIAILIISAIGLGLAAYSRSGFNFLPKSGAPSSSTQSASPSASQGTRVGAVPNAQEKAALLAFPTSESSAQEHQDFISLVEKFAVSIDKVAFNDACEPNPFVAAVSKDQEFSLENSGKEGITINIDEKHSYSVPPGQSVTAKADLVNGVGVHGFFCSKDSGKPVGVLLVE